MCRQAETQRHQQIADDQQRDQLDPVAARGGETIEPANAIATGEIELRIAPFAVDRKRRGKLIAEGRDRGPPLGVDAAVRCAVVVGGLKRRE